MTFDRLLVANRGEIACRVTRTAKALGLGTVAVHSAIDADARHVRQADQAVDLGGTKPADSYLLGERIIAAALATGAQAIHPGYGFLSENAAFAEAVAAAGLVFVGPPAAAIRAMGSKSAAKALMTDAGVPLVPGYHGEDQSLATFRDAAARIGYPVLLKATAGGGGKGMKIVEREADLAEGLASAQREALSAFGDARMLVEKYVLQPRHVEIQVFADAHGHCLYLNERDCSIQRRHQKVIEEAPAPGLTPDLRRAMGEAAVQAAQAIGYVGAGTVEFLLDARGDFFFMEMNTRLQVEHPVTEAITGLDLVAWQLRVAAGEPLPLTQAQVPLHGHAIEVRLYAEDTDQGFLPASGTLQLYREPAAGPGRRVDSGVEEGDEVSPFYDPMLAKLIAWGDSREQARKRLLAMLEDTAVGGFATNLAFLQRLLAHPAFAAAELDTGFIERHQAALLPAPAELPETFWTLAGQAWLATLPAAADPTSPWASRQGWRLGGPPRIALRLACRGEVRSLSLVDPRAVALSGDRLHWQVDGVRHSARLHRRGPTLFVEWQDRFEAVTWADPLAEVARQADAGGLTAPMNASVVAVSVAVGDTVEAGAPLVVLEAMKMEHSIRAPRAGVVGALFCSPGELVAEGTPLIELDEVAP
ncbi:3-methylcrotonyl-CoA carboxylase alpha subunit [Pseudomonas psychrotolerans L19]|uniref:acetyl/propionyl/methylcrotonyl-CoA carboxylase subunit alpha n=1 Tax=Pseudomonas TaxID=286 RepID=UPI00023A3D94|nr:MULTISPECIES: acetyl/propionyl/methylcrotonyl-CoA carboxylase subunit alpha [Pseudomonas]EHK72721.1 3-methylcrotonyl-CoA carboxylase alpha subunit [Pseudomonas psychrotolerans L19]MBA1179224.1 acetyl/propionyl/methylcrotonyl-CoA carboxylase subunit alpha [Pseudomonas psychrotolerans]MBA1211788.1 acetyl/propionyl/methylcrotonyl-CoA carboxylase subunit alpha [Pseudomonas psychrotolerans]TCQ92369.1 3-methylcrotonoyl-CoA carboxylase alpha subunit [Pseudomonas sp. JUb52]